MGKFTIPKRALGLQSEPCNNKYGFIFSSDVRDWYNSKFKVHNENCRKKYAQKKSLRNVRLSFNHIRVMNDMMV